MIDRLLVPRGMSRRHFLGHMATTTLAVPAIQFFGAMEANAQQLRKANKSCILLWMSGGPDVGLFAGTVSRLPRAGTWMLWVKRVFALLMLGVAEWYLIEMGKLLI